MSSLAAPLKKQENARVHKVSHGLASADSVADIDPSGCQLTITTLHPCTMLFKPQPPVKLQFFLQQILTEIGLVLRIAGKGWLFKHRSSYLRTELEALRSRDDARNKL